MRRSDHGLPRLGGGADNAEGARRGGWRGRVGFNGRRPQRRSPRPGNDRRRLHSPPGHPPPSPARQPHRLPPLPPVAAAAAPGLARLPGGRCARATARRRHCSRQRGKLQSGRPHSRCAGSTAAAAARVRCVCRPTGASAAHAKGAQKGGVCAAAAAAPGRPPPTGDTCRAAHRGSAAPPRLDSRPSSACRGGNPPHQPCFLASGEGGVGGDQQGLAAGRPGWVRHRPLVPAPICAESGERTTPPAGRPIWQWVGRLAQEAEL